MEIVQKKQYIYATHISTYNFKNYQKIYWIILYFLLRHVQSIFSNPLWDGHIIHICDSLILLYKFLINLQTQCDSMQNLSKTDLKTWQ